MKLIKKGERLTIIWRGCCRTCGSEFEDTNENVRKGKVENCMREHYEFAHRDCPECGAKAGGRGVILYPKKS